MPTYAELTHDLLNDAAAFFRTLAQQNEVVRAEMSSNADIYERMALLIKHEPTGISQGGPAHKELAAKLLRDTAKFYRMLAKQNAPISEQMDHNANIYDQIADAVAYDPLDVLD
jgi:hypothetical protein